MRVIAGRLGGRQFEAPRGHRTHPMGDRIRGALFNVLGDIEGLSVLDAFAGSGALSFEAISRGAKEALAIDVDKNAYDTIQANAASLSLKDQVKVIRANASSWSDNNKDAQFDLVFAAPPYDDVQLALVQKLTKHVVTRGVFVLDWPGSLEVPELQTLERVSLKNYGDAQLVFYRKNA